VLPAVILVLLAACGAGERQAPRSGDLVIQKPDSNSGDKQVGVAGRPLPEDFHALVTRDGAPVPGVTVYWTTMQGTMDPPAAVTDAHGISASRWTTEHLYEEQEAYASLDPVTGPRAPGSVLPDMIQYTALPYPDPAAPTTVLVVTDSTGNRFQPADITVVVGDTVNWFWDMGAADHNVLPDDGDLPPPSGPPHGYPWFHSFQFMNPGVYHYHCGTHGAAGGVGMSGTVIVLPRP
jgi:plastocyanin